MLKSILLYILGILLLGAILLGGLNLAEKGIIELTAPEKDKGQAMGLDLDNKTLVVTFAGRTYSFSIPR